MGAKFLRDGAHLFSAEVLSRLLAFSVSFVLARQVGLEALAVLALAQSVVAYATVAGDAGLGTDAVRRISNGEAAKAVVKQTARVQVLFAALASLIAVPAALLQTGSLVALGVAVVPLLVAASCTYVLQGRLDARGLARSRIWGNVVVGVSGITSSLLGLPLEVIALSYSAGALVSTIYVNRLAGVSLSELFGPVPWASLSAVRMKYFALASYTVILHAYSSALIIMAQNLGGGAQFVEVALATRVMLLLVIPAQLLGSLLLPRYSRRHVSLRSVSGNVALAMLLGVVMSLVVHFTAGWFVPLMFGADSQSSVRSVEMISLQLPLSLASSVLIAFFLAVGKYAMLARLYLLALAVQIAFGLVLREQEAAVFVLSLVASEWIFVLALLVALLFYPVKAKPSQRQERDVEEVLAEGR